MTELDWAWLDTPVGQVSAGCSATGVVRVRFGGPPAAASAAPPGLLAAAARDQLAEYFRGQRRAFDVPLDWSATSGTQRQVLQVLAESVGYGQTTSYGALGAIAGIASTDDLPPARAVGKIMGSNPIPIIVPCHRVLASNGLGGFSGGTGLDVKQWLLMLEGSLPPTLDFAVASS